LYYVLELLEGGSLQDLITNKYQFSLEETREIIKGLLLGIIHMNEQSKIFLLIIYLDIMHRDLKPDNILFRE